MAGNTEVGKISLVIDLTQDLEKEIGASAKLIADGLQNKLSGKNLKLNADTSEIKKSIDNIPSIMSAAMESTKAIMESATQGMKSSIESNINQTIQDSMAQLTQFSLPAPKGQADVGNVSPTASVLPSEAPAISPPSNFIDVAFTDLKDEASNTLQQVNGMVEGTADKAKTDFTEANNAVKGNIDKTINDTSTKSNNFISSLMARLKSIQMPHFDFSKFKVPKFDFSQGSAPKQEPVLGTDAQRLQMDGLISQMDIFSAKADDARAHVNALKAQIAELSKPTGSPIQNSLNEYEIQKLRQEMKSASEEEEKFGMKSDAVNAKIATLEEKMKQAASATNNNTKAVKGKGDALDNAGRKGGLFGGIFSKLTGIMKNGQNASKSAGESVNRMGSSFNSTGKMITRMLLGMVMFNTVFKGLGAMASYLGSAFMSNERFRASIMQTRSNLLVAFQPIYNAILPGLNALASGLARVSGYIASFMSQLFGTTYQASFKGAQALQNQMGALDITERQAKKTADSLGSVGNNAQQSAKDISDAAEASKKGLAGFDELNKLGEKTDKVKTPGSGVVEPITPMANMAPIESETKGFADKVKKLFTGLFAPFRQSWASEGQNTINSFKYALGGIGDLIGSIGRSFYTVWTNGTGTKILENTHKILQNIFNIVGDIGHIWANAWNKGNIGTQIVQGVANAINNVLMLVDKMGKSIRNVLASEGPTFANMFMESLKAATGVIENVTQKLGWIWDHGGKHAFEGLLKLGAKIGELAMYIYTNFIAPLVNWFVNILAPAIAPILDIVGKIFDKFSELIGWLTSDGQPVLDALIITIGSIWSGFKLWEGVQKIVKGINIVMDLWRDKTKLMAEAQAALNFILSANPIGIVVFAIGALVTAFILAYNKCEWFRDGVNKVFRDIANFVRRGINGLIDGINRIPEMDIPIVGHIGGYNIEHLPMLATGGVVDQPTLAMVGEAGKEAVMPLENNTGWIDNLAGKISSKNSGVGNNEMLEILKQILKAINQMSGDLIFNIDGDTFARIAIKQLNKRRRATGKIELII